MYKTHILVLRYVKDDKSPCYNYNVDLRLIEEKSLMTYRRLFRQRSTKDPDGSDAFGNNATSSNQLALK